MICGVGASVGGIWMLYDLEYSLERWVTGWLATG